MDEHEFKMLSSNTASNMLEPKIVKFSKYPILYN